LSKLLTTVKKFKNLITWYPGFKYRWIPMYIGKIVSGLWY